MPDTIINIDIEGIGPVCFNRSRRARRIIISVSPAKGVRVSVPLRISIGKAVDFVHLKQNWIRKHQAIIARVENRKQALGIHLQTIDKAAATKQLRDRLEFLAREHGFSCNRVTVRRQKTRWGSCSPRNNISLNIKLVQLPAELMDYVILHELTHTRVHNHSRKFWAELDKYVKNSKSVSRRLKADGMLLL
jgi:predicted metal-dependent hydrolase